MYFIRVHDVVKNQEYVFNRHPVEKTQVHDLFQRVFEHVLSQQMPDSKQSLSLSTYDSHCEIYEEKTVHQAGWVWSSESKVKQVVYFVSLLPLLCDVEHARTAESQTEPCIDEEEPEETHFTVGTGYARQFFGWQDSLYDELQIKFTTPGFGLRPPSLSPSHSDDQDVYLDV